MTLTRHSRLEGNHHRPHSNLSGEMLPPPRSPAQIQDRIQARIQARKIRAAHSRGTPEILFLMIFKLIVYYERLRLC